MPIKKRDNKKNAPVEMRNSALVPKKEEAGRTGRLQTQQAGVSKKVGPRITALSTVGKKKRPK